MNASGKARIHRMLLYVALACIVLFEAGYAFQCGNQLLHRDRFFTQPFTYDYALRVTTTQASAKQAGLKLGDQVLAINEKAFRSDGVLARAMATAGTSRSLLLQVKRVEGQQESLRVPLQTRHMRDPFLVFVTGLLLPTVCTLLAALIVLTRPGEATTWSLLGLLTSFSMIAVLPGWYGPLRPLAVTCMSILPETLGIWLLSFAISFPALPAWRSYWKLVANVLMVVIAIVCVLDALAVLSAQVDFARFVTVRQHYTHLQAAINVLLSASLLLFSLLLLLKMRVVGPRSDFYRRLQLIGVGACISLGPSLTLVLCSYLWGFTMRQVPRWLEILTFGLLIVFPLTLSYVFLVYKALGVRALARDGIRRLSGSERQDLLSEFAVALLLAVAFHAAGATPLLTIVLSMVVLFVLLKTSLIRSAGDWIDRRLFRERHTAEQLLFDAVEPATQYAPLETALRELLQRIASSMQTDHVIGFIRKGDVFCFEYQTSHRAAEDLCFPAEGRLASLLKRKHKPVMIYASDPNSPVLGVLGEESEFIEQLAAEVILPMRGTHDLLGFISLGPRRWDQAYSKMDLRMLSMLAKECTLLLENSQLLSRLTEEVLKRERKHNEKLAAEATARTKSDLLAQMSHEFRTPLNAILGYSEMLTEEAEDLGAAHMVTDLNRIHSAGKHLLDLINAVLDMAKLESGQMQLHLEIFALERVLREVSSIAAPLMLKNKNEFVFQIAPDLGAMEADVTKLRQVLLNLLSNAAKFTSKGQITLRAVVERVDDMGWVSIDISDTGLGMTEEQIAKLCVPFRQADSSITRKYGGTGLGLAISRQFCQLMRGDLVIESRLHQGSTFRVRLPLAVSRYDQALLCDVPPVRDLLEPSTVLVIDDDAIVCDLVSRFLAGLPVKVLSSTTGTEGLRLAAHEKPTCILLDIIMPDKDGWAVLRELKSSPTTAHIPVVICSIIADRSFAYSLGAADVLNKPMMRGEVVACISSLLASAHAPLSKVRPEVAELTPAWLELNSLSSSTTN